MAPVVFDRVRARVSVRRRRVQARRGSGSTRTTAVNWSATQWHRIHGSGCPPTGAAIFCRTAGGWHRRTIRAATDSVHGAASNRRSRSSISCVVGTSRRSGRARRKRHRRIDILGTTRERRQDSARKKHCNQPFQDLLSPHAFSKSRLTGPNQMMNHVAVFRRQP